MIGIQDQYFGTEIEMTGITRQRAAEVVAELFGTEAVYEGAYYGIWSARDREGKSGSSCLTEALIHKENQVVESYQQIENIQQRWYHRNYPMMRWGNYRKLYAVCGDMEVLSMSPVVSMFM